jgi:hypothetical protein
MPSAPEKAPHCSSPGTLLQVLITMSHHDEKRGALLAHALPLSNPISSVLQVSLISKFHLITRWQLRSSAGLHPEPVQNGLALSARSVENAIAAKRRQHQVFQAYLR